MKIRAACALLLVSAVVFGDEVTMDDAGERVPLLTVTPAYPEKARRARLEGEVEVCFNVDREGHTSRVAVRRSSNRVFERPSINAIKASTFKPLPVDRKLSGIKTCRTFRFVLSPVIIDDMTD